MSTGLNIALIICGVLLVIVIGGAFILMRLKKLKETRVNDVKSTLEGHNILYLNPAANSFGQTSLGVSQVRGTGVLAFLKDEIFFLMWIPKDELRIPMSSIKNIDTTRSHLGKRSTHELLKIHFTNKDGQEDSVAWMVTDLNQTLKRLKKLHKDKG